MTEKQRWWGIGNRLAPPRFALFALLFVVGMVPLIHVLGKARGIMGAFDIASAVFLVSLIPLFRRGNADHMRRAARDNDANRAVLLGIVGATMLVILVAVADELKGKNDSIAVTIVIVTLALAWLFSNMVYALHYAHLFYSAGEDGKDAGGVDIPHCDQPDYWDFLYFSYTLGMTFQTSDVQITTRRMRRVAIGQCLAAFVFNLGVIAFTINVLGGGGN
ncbi:MULTISPECIES: DUF1345 domain-containing protein [unclassified Sphingomonas]|jgi:uncharacterized membrane protein|uniref:DUF1345 domain-containing protein n=1 Tax=unclassified Sphingomonas TaxID=196159 RepID=UPI000E101E66|nr:MULTISPECIES: DUF1345 domain-containing protein [unclassified Sphingomonas]AXJ94966.1 DUF1345 domain-containing protein [Sphingomonas sp. FARSPH]